MQNLSPKKKRSLGKTKFSSSLQNFAPKSDNVLGFGEANYKIIRFYALSYSPVKMELIDHKNCNPFVFNEQCDCSENSNRTVTYENMKHQSAKQK